MELIAAIKAGTQVPPAGIVTLKLTGGREWIESFAPGHVVANWDVDPAYYNLEDAVIAGWLACLAEQMVFYATNTLIDEGEVTRTVDFRLTYLENIEKGRVRMEARVDRREGNTMWVDVRFLSAGGALMTKAAATVEVHKSK